MTGFLALALNIYIDFQTAFDSVFIPNFLPNKSLTILEVISWRRLLPSGSIAHNKSECLFYINTLLHQMLTFVGFLYAYLFFGRVGVLESITFFFFF